MPSKKAPPPVYQLKITLIGIEPPIWRAIQVPGSIKMCCLHSALQVVMGWKDSHLDEFEKDGKRWGIVQLYENEELDVTEDSDARLCEVLKSEGESMIYSYDFGDYWQHEVLLEKIIPVSDVVKVPLCLAGERRCPPEDVGGVSGYKEFLEIIVDPTHEEYEHYVGWVGGHFLDEFNVKAVNEILARMRWPIRHKR
jgi:Plasmid pRiA4b ORF-3-like protein